MTQVGGRSTSTFWCGDYNHAPTIGGAVRRVRRAGARHLAGVGHGTRAFERPQPIARRAGKDAGAEIPCPADSYEKPGRFDRNRPVKARLDALA